MAGETKLTEKRPEQWQPDKTLLEDQKFNFKYHVKNPD